MAIVRVLLQLQAGFALVSAVGALALGLVGGLLPVLLPVLAVTLGGAAGVLLLASRLERGSRRARRLVVLGEGAVLLFATVDLGLAIAFTHAPLDLAALLTRVALPVAVLWLLRRPRRPPPPATPAAVTV